MQPLLFFILSRLALQGRAQGFDSDVSRLSDQQASLEALIGLAEERWPSLTEFPPPLQAREVVVEGGALTPTGLQAATSKPSQGCCVEVDILSTSDTRETSTAATEKSVASRAKSGSSHFESNKCCAHALWVRGSGLSVDGVANMTDKLCSGYTDILLEDEFLLNSFQSAALALKEEHRCVLHAMDPHETDLVELAPLPWAPGGVIPVIDKALVSFHAYLVYESAAAKNPQHWLRDPDFWNPAFMQLRSAGALHICLNKDDCLDDDRPFRLMFWEVVSAEFVSCVARGIMPIYYQTMAIHEYIDRNVLLVPYNFQDPEGMVRWVHSLSSPEGILQYGTPVFMQRQSNHILANLYWRQDVRLRALLALGSGQKRQLSSQAKARQAVVAEFLICVVSATDNIHLRDIVRKTWGRQDLIETRHGTVRLRLFFFLGDTDAGRLEQQGHSDVVVLPSVAENFSDIWVKTAAVMAFGSRYFAANMSIRSEQTQPLRFLMKCDDDAFVDIHAVAEDILAGPTEGLYWGHIMALVEPNRNETDKYFVPRSIYPLEYYPPYARGMAYVLAEDLVKPLGTALSRAELDPFPYREDVSIGLYLFTLARRGQVRVAPRQRRDSMPLTFDEYCLGSMKQATPLLVLHRFRPKSTNCLVEAMQQAGNSSPDFCKCAVLEKVAE